tara:strand:- start:40 stop:507 length:468 start_codon:yes stop_codon:yes gene_type:complete
MANKYIHIYNKLINLTRNKNLYKGFKSQDTVSDRLIFFLLHFAFFLNIFKNDKNRIILQEIYDFIFRQIELSIREIGYGDQSINKKMKDYLNLFHSMIDKVHFWNNHSEESKLLILANFLNDEADHLYLSRYFDEFRKELSNNTLNSFIKGVVKQ